MDYISKQPTILTLLSLFYLMLTVFVLRSYVEYFFLASGLAIICLALVLRQIKLPILNQFAHWLILLSAIGLSASIILTIEKVELLINPDHITSCSISPIVACSPVIESDQASVFGFPNPIIGIFGFGAILGAGMTILAGKVSSLERWWWHALLVGGASGVGFSAWLMFQALYRINSLCLYCMSVWLVSFALLWLVAAAALRHKAVSFGPFNRYIDKPLQLIVVSYIVIFGLIFIRWADYWTSLL